MKYFFLQTKRVCRAFPAILITTLILTGALALLCYLQTASDSESEEHQKISLGLVGDAEDPYLGFGVSLLQEMDSSRFTCTLTEMSEEEAQRALEKQQIHGYLIIPDDFLESVMSGENSKVTFVTGISQNGIGTLLARELADAVSTLLTETQSGIYAFQRFSEQHGAVENLTSDIYDINMRYFQYVLPRAELYDIDTPDSSPVISMQGYYFCALLLLFFLFLGTSGCHLFIRSDLSLNRILAVHGLGPVRQVLAEYSSCCILLLLSYLVIGAFLRFCSGTVRDGRSRICAAPVLPGSACSGDRRPAVFSFAVCRKSGQRSASYIFVCDWTWIHFGMLLSAVLFPGGNAEICICTSDGRTDGVYAECAAGKQQRISVSVVIRMDSAVSYIGLPDPEAETFPVKGRIKYY